MGSAVFAALTSILAKIGIEGGQLYPGDRDTDGGCAGHCPGGMVLLTGTQGGMKEITPRSWLFFDLVRAGDGGVVAVLLPRAADRRGRPRWCRWTS